MRQIKKLKLFFTRLTGWQVCLILSVVLALVYQKTLPSTVYGGDAGDFLAAIATNGIAHPPGYPLYTTLGILLNKIIPEGTLAFKISFLSLIPSILSALLLYIILTLLTGSILIPLIAVLVMAVSYPYWLLSVIVEVFALNNLFLISILFTFYLYYKFNKVKFFYLGVFLFGLALTHHHLVLLILPAIIFLITRRGIILSWKKIFLSLFFFFSGFAYYFYVFLSSKYNPPVNWMGSPIFKDFFNLLFRTIYGSLTVGKFVNANIPLKLVSLWAFADFLIQDLKIPNLLIIIFGIIFLSQKNKRFFKLFLLLILPFVFFLFYAGFPLGGNFILGTFERFILPVFLFFTIPYSFGLVFVNKLLAKLSPRNYRLFIQIAFFLILAVFEFRAIYLSNYQKFLSLKNDFTAENLASDILSSVEKNAVIILSTDTALFNSQYLYYTQKKWPEVKLVHFSKLYLPFYSKTLKKAYPDLEGIKLIKNQNDFEIFLEINSKKYSIYSKVNFQLKQGYFLPHGLLYKYYSNQEKVIAQNIIEENEKLFANFHDPAGGALGKYQHLLLSDVLRIYSQAYLEIAYYEAQNNYGEEAKKYLVKIKEFDPEESDAYLISAQILIKQGNCRQAEKEINIFSNLSKDNIKSDYLKYLNYSLCDIDEEKALFYKKSYDEKIK